MTLIGWCHAIRDRNSELTLAAVDRADVRRRVAVNRHRPWDRHDREFAAEVCSVCALLALADSRRQVVADAVLGDRDVVFRRRIGV